MSDHEPTLPPEDQYPTQAVGRIQQPGDTIDKYRLLQVIGEGGMGEVWLAEQLEPIRRRVALKVIKQGMDTREVVARFDTERQVLARLDHPNIAKVLDAGATENGRPFFVMEYVEGVTITDYCDRHHLTTQQRLELFFKVCEGVQHAHRNAIIHRDIKPGNVLVTLQNSEPVPKIIDFGVAKATDKTLSEQTLFTELGQLLGTPEFMSPEQAEMSGLGIDTRTDIYSLGVLLYVLLVGVLPFDSRELRRAGFDEIRRRIREVEPTRPSSRLTTMAGKLPTVAKARGTSPAKLSHELRGDLDWIVMKALDKDRTRRYETPVEMADDLRRYLRNEPVIASPPSAIYRTRKFVRRHTVGVAFAVVVFTLVSVLAATMTVQAGRVARERDRANRQAQLAQEQAETSRQVADFLVDLFDVSDPDHAQGKEVTAREILDQGAERIGEELSDQPAIRATMLRTIGRVYTRMGLYPEAEILLEQAIELGERGSTDELEYAASLLEMAPLHLWQGEHQQGELVSRQALEIRERLLGPEHPDVATALNALGNTLQNQGKLPEARDAHQRALAIREATLPAGDSSIASSLHNLAIVHYFMRNYDTAEELYKRSATIEKQSLGGDSPAYATSLHTLAILYLDQNRLDEALEYELLATEIRKRALGTDHLHYAYSLCTLGEIHRQAGRPRDAEPVHRRALTIGIESVGPDTPDVLWMRGNLAATLIDLEQYDEAETLIQTSLSTVENAGERQELPPILDDLARLQHRQGRLEEAAETYHLSQEIVSAGSVIEDPDRLEALRDHALLLGTLGKPAEASALAAKADSLDSAGR